MKTTENAKSTELYDHLLTEKVIGCAIEAYRLPGVRIARVSQSAHEGFLENIGLPKNGIKKFILYPLRVLCVLRGYKLSLGVLHGYD